MIKKLEQFIAKLNSNQKLILAITTPIFLFIVFVALAKSVYSWKNFDPDSLHWQYYNFSEKFNTAFNFSYSWWIWLIYVAIIGFIEYKIFEDKLKAN